MTYNMSRLRKILWALGNLKKSKPNKLQAFQSITFRVLSNASCRHISNRILHYDFNILTISILASYYYIIHFIKVPSIT